MTHLMIVESPAKAKTINKYLGTQYDVVASYGHVRDLPAKNGSVDPENNFAMIWESDPKAKKRIAEIADKLKKADTLILATDPDREGEAISWHIIDSLNKKGALKNKKIQRVVFNAITKNAILKAVTEPRNINQDLVDAYLARRGLDYLVGFTLSPILWRKLPGMRSAGRVQSVSLRLICARENEIKKFVSQEYWQIVTQLKASQGQFEARLHAIDGKAIQRLGITTQEQAEDLKKQLEHSQFTVESIEKKDVKKQPSPPFTTSTLQQEASRKLHFSSAKTMQISQKLYEGKSIDGNIQGLITYMRTDGIHMAPEALNACIDTIKNQFGPDYLPAKPRYYKTKAKNSQEAHEAIRPTQFLFKPQDISKYLDKDEYALYNLIWKRTLGSQMADAIYARTQVNIKAHKSDSHDLGLRANGNILKFDGFLKLYGESHDADEKDSAAPPSSGEKSNDKRLPAIDDNENCTHISTQSSQHFTEPQARYTEATLIKKLEELGIGRPSTYAAILSILQTRGYMIVDKKQLVPAYKGLIVTAFLENHFGKYVEYDFTANLEESLDRISDGKLNWQKVMQEFWTAFYAHTESIKDLRITQTIDELNDMLADYVFKKDEEGNIVRNCPLCRQADLSIKLSRHGTFIGCTRYPDCNYTRTLGDAKNTDTNDTEEALQPQMQILGTCPETQANISLKTGRYGPYIERDKVKSEKKPKRVGIPKEWPAADITIEKALQLLSLPRLVGLHPETHKEITADLGRYGPYLSCDGLNCTLPSVADVLDIGLNRAVDMLHNKKNAPKGSSKNSREKKSNILRHLGKHTETGIDINILDGRYGPYIKYEKLNVTLGSQLSPDTITLEEAIKRIDEKNQKK